MELDELKILLQQKKVGEEQQKSSTDLALLLKKNTQSVVSKLKRSLYFEIVWGWLFGLLCMYEVFFGSMWSLQIYFGVFGGICLAFSVVLYYLVVRIDKLNNTTLPVKHNLQAIYSIIQEFVKRYYQFTMLLIPIAFTFSFWLGYKDKSDDTSFMERLQDVHSKTFTIVAVVVIIMIVFLLVMKWFTKCYLKKLYGVYLIQLKELIGELGD